MKFIAFQNIDKLTENWKPHSAISDDIHILVTYAQLHITILLLKFSVTPWSVFFV